MIHIKREYMHQGVDVTTPYHAFMIRLYINIWSLLDSEQANKRANGKCNLTWVDIVAIYRDQLSGVALVPTSTIGGVKYSN